MKKRASEATAVREKVFVLKYRCAADSYQRLYRFQQVELQQLPDLLVHLR